MEERRIKAFDIAHPVLNKRASLSDFSVTARDLSDHERAFVKELVYGTVRYKNLIDHYFHMATGKHMNNVSNKSATILRLAVYQLMFMSKPEYAVCDESVKIAKTVSEKEAGFVNWALREFLRHKDKSVKPEGNDKKDISVRYSYPIHFVEHLIKENGVEHAEELLEFYNTIQPMTAFDIKTGEFREVSTITDISNTEYVMDPTYFNMFRVLRQLNVQTVMDCCAAPGGKTLLTKHIFPKAKITAIDIDKHRCKITEDNFKRLKIDTEIINEDFLAFDNNKVYDLVLLDVPCTSTGTIRKNPDVKYSYRNRLGTLTALQKKLIERADRFVKENGHILYTTCSVLHEENHDIISSFVLNGDYTLFSQNFTFGNPHNGGYGALLKKTGGEDV